MTTMNDVAGMTATSRIAVRRDPDPKPLETIAIDKFLDDEAGDIPVFTVAMITYARDVPLANAIARIALSTGHRNDCEFILIDNNDDDIDRSEMLRPLGRARYVKLGFNMGVPARNEALRRARGEFIFFSDDDVLVEPVEFLDLLAADFAADPKLGCITGRPIVPPNGDTPREMFPHTDKSRDQNSIFKTFRFQGCVFALRREVRETVGYLCDYIFYGLEEIEYAYRIIDAGYHILYDSRVRVLETNDPGGRKPYARVQQQRLTNKYIISYRFMPFPEILLNLPLFTLHIFWNVNRGRMNIFPAIRDFMAWLATPGRLPRRVIGQTARNYILDCGGQIWK